jgi:hypothetical protein
MELIHFHIFVPHDNYCKVEGIAECERIQSAIRGSTGSTEILVIQTVYDESNINHQALGLPRLPYAVIYDPQQQMAMQVFDPAQYDIAGIRNKVAYYGDLVEYNEESGTYEDNLGPIEPFAQISLGKANTLGGLGINPFRLFNWPGCDQYLPSAICSPTVLSLLLLAIIGLLVFKILK